MKHYDLIIDGERVSTGKSDNMYRADEIIKNPGKIIALQIKKLPEKVVVELKNNPSNIKTDDPALQYIVNFVKRNGFPEYRDEDFEKIVFATYSIGSNKENKLAIQSAKESFEKFKSFSLEERVYILETFMDKLIMKREIFRKISYEVGVFNLFEMTFNLVIYGMLNHTCMMFYKQQMMPRQLTEYSYILKQPYGIFGIMLPYNDFFFDGLIMIISSILSGNACIVKMPRYPAILLESIEILHDTLSEFNVPKGIVNVISGNSKEIAEEWINNDDVNGIIFDGNSKTGLDIGGEATKKAKKVILQLAGCDPVLVWKDVDDLDEAVEKIVMGRFVMSGQMCNTVKRAYVHHEIYEEFVNKLIKEVSQLKIALPVTPDYCWTDQIMIGSPKVLIQLTDIIEDAIEKGAELKMGGKRINYLRERDDNGLFFEPTVLINVNHSMKIMTEETFGPILPIMKVKDIDEAIHLINSLKYGLRASIWAHDRNIIRKFIDEVNTGNITVNELNNFYYYFAPHQGGTKLSGITGDKYFHEEMCYNKYVYEAPY